MSTIIIIWLCVLQFQGWNVGICAQHCPSVGISLLDITKVFWAHGGEYCKLAECVNCHDGGIYVVFYVH